MENSNPLQKITTETMSPLERIDSAAQAKGGERREKIMQNLDRLLGVDAAIKETGIIVKEKALSVKERVQNRLTETKNRAVERVNEARDRTVNRYNEIKGASISKANDIKDKATKFGLEKGLNIENKIVAITTGALTNKLEKKAFKSAQTAEATETQLSSRVSEFAQEKFALNQNQLDELVEFINSQASERLDLKQSQKEETLSLESEINEAKRKAAELSEKATERRGVIESKRVFKELLEKFNNS